MKKLIVEPYIITWITHGDFTGPIRTHCDVSLENGVNTDAVKVFEDTNSLSTGLAICSEEDRNNGLFTQQYGMYLSLRRALSVVNSFGNPLIDKPARQYIWSHFKREVGFVVPPAHPPRPKVPKNIEGLDFQYKGEKYTVIEIVYIKAPKQEWIHQSSKIRIRKRPWVPAVVYEGHKGLSERFVRPYQEFINKFQLVKYETRNNDTTGLNDPSGM